MGDYSEVPFEIKMKALTEAFEWAAACPVRWDKQPDVPRSREENRPWVELSLMRMQTLGMGETRYEDEVSYEIGQKLLMIQAKFRSRSQFFSDFAFARADKTKTRLGMSVVQERWLGPNDMSVAEMTDVLDIPDGFKHDSRVEDVAVFELHLNTFMSESDEANVAYFIENIELTSNMKTAGDTPLDASLQLDKEVI